MHWQGIPCISSCCCWRTYLSFCKCLIGSRTNAEHGGSRGSCSPPSCYMAGVLALCNAWKKKLCILRVGPYWESRVYSSSRDSCFLLLRLRDNRIAPLLGSLVVRMAPGFFKAEWNTNSSHGLGDRLTDTSASLADEVIFKLTYAGLNYRTCLRTYSWKINSGSCHPTRAFKPRAADAQGQCAHRLEPV